MEFSENITRRIQLWIDNERGWTEMCREWANEILDDPPQSEVVKTRKKCVFELADRMEDFFVRLWDEAEGTNMVQEEILRTALEYVEWDEIAESYISVAEEERNRS